MRLEPQFAAAAINLADLYRQQGRDSDGSTVLRTAILASPRDAGLHHALGLALVRAKQLGDAITELRFATELDDQQARYAYVYAVALHSADRKDEAISAFKGNLARHPGDRDTLIALINFLRDDGKLESALEYAQQLAKLTPNDRTIDNHISTLKARIEKSMAH